MIDTQTDNDLFLSAHKQFAGTVDTQDAPWLQSIRKAAITRFGELGLPGKRNEDWKYTSLTPLTKIPFKLAKELPSVSETLINEYAIADSHQLVFVNGVYCPELSRVEDVPEGVVIADLATAVSKHSELVEPHLARYAQHDELALTALNTAFIKDGTFIHVPTNGVVEKPIHIIHVNVTTDEPTMCFPRHLIVAERSSQVTESYVGKSDQQSLTNSVVELVADANARVDHYKVVRESDSAFHIANLQVKQQRDSNVFSHYFALGGGLIRNESRTLFAGENAECTFNGLYMGHGKQHIDNHTVIDHAVPHCNSYELYKGLLDDKSHGVFNGKIFVRIDAQKTDAKQTNQCILLSDDAVIDTKPQLEIFADDVKCTHGATIGQLDEKALFYLRARGIKLEQARRLLIYAFANDVVERVAVEPVRQQLQDTLLARQSLPHLQES